MQAYFPADLPREMVEDAGSEDALAGADFNEVLAVGFT